MWEPIVKCFTVLGHFFVGNENNKSLLMQKICYRALHSEIGKWLVNNRSMICNMTILNCLNLTKTCPKQFDEIFLMLSKLLTQNFEHLDIFQRLFLNFTRMIWIQGNFQEFNQKVSKQFWQSTYIRIPSTQLFTLLSPIQIKKLVIKLNWNLLEIYLSTLATNFKRHKSPLRYALTAIAIFYSTPFSLSSMPVHFKQSQTMKAQATVLTNLFLYAEQTISGNGYRYISWNIFIISGEGLWRNKEMPQTYLLPACFCGLSFVNSIDFTEASLLSFFLWFYLFI